MSASPAHTHKSHCWSGIIKHAKHTLVIAKKEESNRASNGGVLSQGGYLSAKETSSSRNVVDVNMDILFDEIA